MTARPRVVVATGNAGKLRELGALLPRVDLLPQSDFDIDGVDETGLTFVENAILKARHAAELSGLPAIADDSGLVVPALDGAPGVRSARYAGEAAGDAANNAKLIAALRGADDRSAWFHCTLVHLRAATDPAPTIVSGRWRGRIVDEPRGSNGFGYDPYFWVEELGLTAAELPADTKNRLSHRGQACRALAKLLAQAA